MSKRNNTRSKISQLTRSQQPTITLPDTRILCLEKMLQEKIEGKHSNINLGLKKSFSIFDTDQSGALDAEEFTKFLSFYIVGIKIEEVAALTRRIYDINSTNAILIKDFQDRIMSPDAGVRLPPPPQPPPRFCWQKIRVLVVASCSCAVCPSWWVRSITKLKTCPAVYRYTL